jgi:hypothetical protein
MCRTSRKPRHGKFLLPFFFADAQTTMRFITFFCIIIFSPQNFPIYVSPVRRNTAVRTIYFPEFSKNIFSSVALRATWEGSPPISIYFVTEPHPEHIAPREPLRQQPHGSAHGVPSETKSRVLGTQSLDPMQAQFPSLTILTFSLSRVGYAPDHPPPTTLTTLQRLVVVPISAGPHTFIGAGTHSFDPQSLLDVVPAVATTMIGVVRKTPPLKERKAEATCPDSPLRPPRDRSGGPLCTGRGSSWLQVP